LRKGGLAVQHREDASHEILRLLDDLESKIGVIITWQSFTGRATAGSDIPALIGKLRELTQRGKLGYWLLVGEKP
jgi:hypothetical protein